MQFSAALFAGGHSLRMGRDKAFLEIDGTPLWQRQVRLLQELEPAELFVSGPPRSEWIEEGLQIIPDAISDAGPLGGLVAVLRRSTNQHLLALAVDLPNMTAGFLGELVAACRSETGVIPKLDNRFEPLAAVYPVSCLPLTEDLLQARSIPGGTTSVSASIPDGTEPVPPQARSLQALARCAVQRGFMIERQISTDEAPLFFNLNTPTDLEIATSGHTFMPS